MVMAVLRATSFEVLPRGESCRGPPPFQEMKVLYHPPTSLFLVTTATTTFPVIRVLPYLTVVVPQLQPRFSIALARACLHESAMTANNEMIDPNSLRRHQFLFSFGAEQTMQNNRLYTARHTGARRNCNGEPRDSDGT